MPDDAGRDAAFYDRETEPRRHVADWGGDELFTRMPSRRPVHPSLLPRHRRPAPLDPRHRSSLDPSARFARTDDDGHAPGDAPDPVGRLGRTGGEGWSPGNAPHTVGRFGRTGEEGSPAGDAPDSIARSGRTDADGGAPGDGSEAARRFAAADGSEVRRFAAADERRPAGGSDRFAVSDDPDAPGGESDLEGAIAAVARARGFNVSAPPERRADSARGHVPGGRRTVVIAGRPDGVPRPRPQRVRPPRTVAERVGPRPERIVAWAFLLGLLLIFIAIATADAATI